MSELCGFQTCPDERIGEMEIAASNADSGESLATLTIPMCDDHHLMVEGMAISLAEAPEKLVAAIDGLANKERCKLVGREED